MAIWNMPIIDAEGRATKKLACHLKPAIRPVTPSPNPDTFSLVFLV